MCLSLFVFVLYARKFLDPFLATQVLLSLLSLAEGPPWTVFACRMTPGFSPYKVIDLGRESF